MASRATPPETHTCECGQQFGPYKLGDKDYWPRACPACIIKINEEERLEEETGKLLRLGFQRRYLDADFDNLHDPKPSEAVIEACRSYAETLRTQTEPDGRGIYLWGPNGTGKTHLAVAITRHAYGHSLFVNTVRLFDELKRSYTTDSVCEIFEAARGARLLILDDLGSERPSDWVQERLYALLSHRWDEMLSTVVTSNIRPQDLTKIVGARSASRVLGSSLQLPVDGPDHRLFGAVAI